MAAPGHRRALDRFRRLRALSRAAGKALPGRTRIEHGLAHAALATAAALVAYVPTHALGLKEGFWAAITALVVVQTEFAAVRSTARDQLLGAVIGGVVGAAAAMLLMPSLARYAAAVAGSILLAWICNVASSARLSAVTVTIILLVPHQNSAGQMMIARLSEVGWGIVAGIGVTWPALALSRRKRRAEGKQ